MLSKEELINIQYDKKLQLKLVKENGMTIQFINNPDKDVQLEAVKQDGYAIRYIHNPDKDVQLEAVKEDGYAIQYIHNPDKEVQLEAVKEDGRVIQYINNPDIEMYDIALGSCNNHNELNKIIKYCDIEKYPELYEYYVIKYTSLQE
jgi:hypothetical protein